MIPNNKISGQNAENLAYVRKVWVKALSIEVQEQVDGLSILYAVHDASGRRLALVVDRQLAFSLAHQNDFLPLSVH